MIDIDMSADILELFNYGLVMIFGIVLSAEFSGVKRGKRETVGGIVFISLLMIAQILSWRLLGLDITKKIYPLIIHTPTVIMLALYYKSGWLKSAVSVLSAYLCCQIPRWTSALVLFIFDNELVYRIGYTFCIIAVVYLINKYIVTPVSDIMDESLRALLLFGAMPLLYYVFDYSTTVYTDLLYRGDGVAVQFMPSFLSVAYFVFVLKYYGEMSRRSEAERETVALSVQANQAKKELSAYRETADLASVYSHDMRHHLALIDGFLAAGEPERASEYIKNAQNDIDRITPVRYCDNSTINLIFSSFAGRAKAAGIEFSVDAQLPETLLYSETELCTLLSNAVENAVNAAANRYDVKENDSGDISGAAAGYVRVNCRLHKNNMLIFIENTYHGRVIMKDGYPIGNIKSSSVTASDSGILHEDTKRGYGVKSIINITQRHNGYYSFTADEHNGDNETGGIFTTKIVLPEII